MRSQPILNRFCKPTVSILCQLCELHDIFWLKISALQGLSWITEIKLKVCKLHGDFLTREKHLNILEAIPFSKNIGFLFCIGETNYWTRLHHYGCMITSILTVDPIPKGIYGNVELKHTNITAPLHSLSAFCTKNMLVFSKITLCVCVHACMCW
jgi:hypothetical protein